jgi:hypothetical protein
MSKKLLRHTLIKKYFWHICWLLIFMHFHYMKMHRLLSSLLDLYLEFDDSGQLSTKIIDKRDDFNFKIINFPNMCSNIPASPAYGAYDKTSSIYLYVKLKALPLWIFLSFTHFWRSSDSYEYKQKSARRGAQFIPTNMCSNIPASPAYGAYI